MNDELTQVDIRKMQEEVDYRIRVLRPQLIEDVKVAREFGDLSENFEYKAAKRDKNRNESRIRYLQQMIRTAVVIAPESREDEIGLFDRVEFRFEATGKVQSLQIVTTLRQNARAGYVSKESPVGQALLGHRVGDRVLIRVSPEISYYVVIQSVEKCEDNQDLPISGY